jgi:hypothetical protein
LWEESGKPGSRQGRRAVDKVMAVLKRKKKLSSKAVIIAIISMSGPFMKTNPKVKIIFRKVHRYLVLSILLEGNKKIP